jgi:raffinose/stachyose/melibiose transport system substrate-binding protein
MKKSSIKSILCIVLSIVLSLSLFAGCSSNPTNTSSTSGTSGTAKTALKGSLTIMHYLVETGKLKALNDTVTGFKAANPGVTVTVEGMSLDQYTNTENMKIAAGDMPDILFGNPKSYSNLVTAGNILDLSNQSFTKRVDSSALLDCTFNGKAYGIPMDLMLSGVIYNKDLFSKNNVSVPTTYDQFITACQTFQKAGVTAVAAGYKDLASVGGSYWAQSFGNMLSQQPEMFGDIMDGAKKPSDFPLLKQFLTQWQIINNYTATDHKSVGIDRAEQDFGSGKAAMIIIGSWAISSIRSYGPNGNFGTFLFPFFNDASKNKMQYNTDDTWMIAQNSPDKANALAYFDYMTTIPAASTWASDCPAVSAITGAKAAKLDPILSDMSATLTSGAACNVDAGICLSGQFQTDWDNEMQLWCFSKPTDSVDTFLKSFDASITNVRTQGN